MKLVTRNDIENWAKSTNSKGDLPVLISRLVRATTPGSTQVNFPSGSATYTGGWDGEVFCQEDKLKVPSGTSLYEFGTEKDSKGKADDDYEKRKNDALGYDPKESVFTFITPRFWRDKAKWIKEKKDEGFWKDVKVYDSSDLEQWLDTAPGVQRWFAHIIKQIPYDGIDLAEEFWKYWSIYDGYILPPEIITSGREREQTEILNFLQGPPSIMSVRAASKDEAIAFIIATAKKFSSSEAERFFSKSLVVHTEGNYKAVSANFNSPLNLIPTFENRLPLYSAVSNNHHVIVPLGADDDFNQNTITLPTIDRNGQIAGLIACGLDNEMAEKYSKESGRNITILKKLLSFPHNKAKWLETNNVREIIPALILGRWNETFDGDIKLIEKLSATSYSDYLTILNKWKDLEESPIIRIGETWRLTSPLDLWSTLSPNLTQQDFKNIQECFVLAFGQGNPIFERPEKGDLAKFFTQQKKYSNWSREGICQSLILIGQFGKNLNIPNLSNPQNWVDKIILDLLGNAGSEIWISVNHELPLIAEASPKSFLKAVNHSLANDIPEIMGMFNEVDALFHTSSNHTGLLWALEGLAWLPEYLQQVGLILLKLSKLDPGGNLTNRPINSLSEIFKPWHYQTLTTFDERMKVLELITGKEKESGWRLLLRMLPDHHGIAHPTHKLRWRMFERNTNLHYTYEEIWATHSHVIKLLIGLFDKTESKFSDLISEVANLAPKDRRYVLDWADSVVSELHQEALISWETIRNILNRHKSFPTAEWAMKKADIDRLDALYLKLKPADAINQNIWLFNEHWPQFPEGIREDDEDIRIDHQERQKKISSARNKAVKVLLQEIGFKEILELRKQIKEPWTLGDALASEVNDPQNLNLIYGCLNDAPEHIGFVHSFIYRKWILEGFEWLKNLISNLQQLDYKEKAISNALIPIEASEQLWTFISSLDRKIQNEYWQNMRPFFYHIEDKEKILGIEKLIEHKRFFSAIDIAFHFADKIPTGLLVEMLTNAVTKEASEQKQFKGYEIQKIFEVLDTRDDVEQGEIINLEWLYLPLLDSYSTNRAPKALEGELTRNPEFFIEVLKWVYLPEDKQKLEDERKGFSDEVIQNRARHAYHLLNSWKKIPGMKADYTIDKNELSEWIKETRALAKEAGRLDVADMQIGKLFAQYPEHATLWPQEILFQIIEDINSDSLYRNYSAAMFNKRGSSTRGPFDGGNIEREHAQYFGKLADNYRTKYPNVADVFRDLEQGYLANSRQMDESAERDKLEY